ncbi:DUF6923 family protein [Shewanella marina]|uniref:DUF6923 family protein n=1 Tax=Shewanella marina TaxID=487319 RepID=UPI000A8D8A20|nr:GEVED domain-containing protein [Shewanella marina]
MMKPVITFGLSLLISNIAIAGPFPSCPTEAYLIQTPSSTPKAYGVNLATGSYTILSNDMGTSKSFNGVGYNYHDNYIYGWDYQAGTLAQVGDDYQITPLTVSKDSASASAGNFYVGDVAVTENAWYGYRKRKGLFKIELNDLNQLSMVKVPGSTANASYNITDMAFHPTDGYLYAVTNGSTGKLLRIDPSNGKATSLGTVIQSSGSPRQNFVFGAQFYDASGNFYMSNNTSGSIYKVKVSEATSAELFSYGPSSSSNDGARCALAAIPVGDNIDFGDAPDSYGTLMDSNGARHSITENFRLGLLIDNESDGQAYPLSDDASDNNDDDDGITTPTGFEIGETAIVLATVTDPSGEESYINAWFDWDQDGKFSIEEQALLAEPVTDGLNTLNIDVPSWATEGTTWARYRLSKQADLSATGGMNGGKSKIIRLP